MSNKLLVFLGLALTMAITGCATESGDTYSSPAYSTSSVKSVAVMPITNQRLNAGQAIETNRLLISALQSRNPGMKIMAGSAAVEAMNDKNLVNPWNNFIVSYSQTGLPNTNTLKEVTNALGVDAIIVGTIARIREQDAAPYVYPYIGFHAVHDV